MWASATQSHSHCRTLSCLSRSGVPPLSKLASIGFSWGSSRSGKFLKLQGKHNLHRRHSHYTALGRAPTKAHPRPTRGAERSGAALASAPAPSSVVITARVGLMRGKKAVHEKICITIDWIGVYSVISGKCGNENIRHGQCFGAAEEVV